MHWQEQRVAIAESCGWTISAGWDTIRYSSSQKCARQIKGYRLCYPDGNRGAIVYLAKDGEPTLRDFEFFQHLPEYEYNLNAMHEAESSLFSLGRDYRLRYRDELIKISEETGTDTFHLSAKDRAKAFLLSLGKWKKSETAT